MHSNSSVLKLLFPQIQSLKRDTPQRYIAGLDAISTIQSIRYLDTNKMYCADTVGDVRAADPMEALIFRKTSYCNAPFEEWRSISQPVAQREVARFEDTFTDRNQTFGDFFSILKEGHLQDRFASALAADPISL